MSFKSDENNLSSSQWVLDSGSSSHMVNNDDLLKNCKSVSTEIVLAKKTQSMTASKIGQVKMEECTLDNVLYVPDLSKNLLSVSAITNNGGEVKFYENKVEVTKSGKRILKGEKNENGLYVINLSKDVNETSAVAESRENLAKLWHRRLGHISYGNLGKLIQLSDGLNIKWKNVKEIETICETCLEAKQTRLPFNTERKRATRPLEIIHTDVCGPVDPLSWDNKKYFITFLDDYTHFAMIFLLKGKYEVADAIKEYVAEVESKWNLKVSKLRCDGGGEYISQILQQWCKQKGVILDYSVPYSPQLNGKAERLNRTLLDKTRALLYDSRLNKEMWGEAVRTATYLLNRSPTETINTTPAEKWYLKRPDLSRLKIFGSTAYACVTEHKGKLDSRSKKYIFIGYTLNGYRLWDEELRKIKISRDVKIDENQIVRNRENDKMERKCIVDEEVQEVLDVNDETDEPSMEDKIHDDDEMQKDNENRIKRSIKLPERFKDFVMLTYQEAVTGDDKDKWKKAIEEEKSSLISNNTWKVVDACEAERKKNLSSKWVFNIKEDGRYKARLVVRGFEQEKGIDFEETYSPVVNITVLRMLFAMAAKMGSEIIQFDVKTAFLYGEIDEEIYMSIPEGFNYENKVLKLQKSLYGLKQASFKWNQRFTNFLKSKNFVQTNCDKCVFKSRDCSLILAIFVDDGIIIGKDKELMKKFLEEMSNEFQIKIEENPKKFLGMEIEKNEKGITIKQSLYIEQVLRKYGMSECKEAVTPILKETAVISEKEINFPYRETVGSLLYLCNKTRPDIALAVNLESRHVENPCSEDIVNVKRTLRYLKGTQGYGIHYPSGNDDSSDLILNAYCDADFAGDKETRRSTTGYVIMFGDNPVSWCARKQPIVALSSTEAEYIAAADCVKELIYLKTLLQELTKKNVVTNLNIDNQSAIKLIKNGIFNRRSKHIEVRFFFCQKG